MTDCQFLQVWQNLPHKEKLKIYNKAKTENIQPLSFGQFSGENLAQHLCTFYSNKYNEFPYRVAYKVCKTKLDHKNCQTKKDSINMLSTTQLPHAHADKTQRKTHAKAKKEGKIKESGQNQKRANAKATKNKEESEDLKKTGDENKVREKTIQKSADNSHPPDIEKFKEIFVPPDGDCFYHAFAYGDGKYKTDKSHVSELRKKTAECLETRIQELRIEELKSGKDNSFSLSTHKEALERVNSQEWAHDVEIKALANCTNITIWIWEDEYLEQGIHPWIEVSGSEIPRWRSDKIIYMRNRGNVHFNVLKPRMKLVDK